MVEMLALLGKDVRMGGKFDVKIQQLAKLDEIDILGTNLILDAAEGKKPVVASKDLTKEVKGVEKEKVEVMVNKVANRAFTTLEKKQV
jgi:uncharacterized membrane protein